MTLNLPEPTTLILSRDELLSALNALEATTISGIDSEPTGPRTEQEMLLAQEVATRSLRARGLARQNNGTISYDNRLLNIVATCAYPTSALTALHWESAENEPARFFGSVRDSVCVAHTRPEELMHRFDMYEGEGQHSLAAALLGFYQLDNPDTKEQASSGIEFTLPPERFSSVRQLSEQGRVQEAQELLINEQIDVSIAKLFAPIFAPPTRLTILQTITQNEENSVLKRDFMLAHTDDRLWFVGAVDGDAAEGLLLIKSVNTDELSSFISG